MFFLVKSIERFHCNGEADDATGLLITAGLLVTTGLVVAGICVGLDDTGCAGCTGCTGCVGNCVSFIIIFNNKID